MIHFSFKIQLFLRAVFCTLLFYSAAFTSSAQLDPIKLEMSSKPARIDSINNGFANLQKRMDLGDPIAKKLLQTMPSGNILQKEELIKGYNSELLLGLQVQKLAEAAGLEKQQHTSIDSLATALRAEQFAYGGSDDSPNAAAGNRLMVSSDESGLSLSAVLVEAPRPARRQLFKLLREYEEKIRRLEKEGGNAPRQAILMDAEAGKSGNVALDMLLNTYYQTIRDIEKQSLALVAIQKAFFEMQSLYNSALELGNKATKQIIGYRGKIILEEIIVIEDDALNAVLEIMQAANELVNNYKKTNFAGILKKMKNAASPEERVTVLQRVFDDLYIAPVSEELARLSNTESLQQSLKFTGVFEQQVAAIRTLGIYPEQDFVQIAGVLSTATTKFLEQIKENDKQTYEDYYPILDTQKERISKVVDLSKLPMTLALFQDTTALFLLTKPSDNVKVLPFSNIARIMSEMEYLNEEEKKALFAYLYSISFNFQAVVEKYLQNTLLVTTPITLKDLAELIEEVKQYLKSGKKPKTFDPSDSDQENLRKFSLRVRSLTRGETREKAIIEKFSSETTAIKNMLIGITPEKMEGYIRVNPLSGKQMDAIGGIRKYWDLVMNEDLPRCNLDQLLAYREELLGFRKDLEERENSGLLTAISRFKGAQEDHSANPSAMTTAANGPADSDSSSAVLAIMEKAITPPRVLHGLSAGLLAGISSGLNKQLAAKNSAATSDIPLPPSAPLLDFSAADIDLSLSSPLAPPPPFGAPAASIKVLSPAEQKAAAALAGQLQKISSLETALQSKAGNIAAEVHEDITQKIKEAKDDIAAGGMRAAMSERKIKLIDKELAKL